MIWVGIGIGVVLAAAGGGLYWRHRRRTRHRLISFVALLKEPMSFDPAVLAAVAGKAWRADLGDGSSEGADGFVVGAGPFNTIMHDGRMFLVNGLPSPYVDEVEKTAEKITDLRLRKLFLKHKAWFSCDALGVDGSTSEEAVREWYRRLGPLFAELLDENCLLVFLPDSGSAYAVSAETESALRSADPVEALRSGMLAPVVQVSDDDPRMKAAVAKARKDWPAFVAAYETGAGEGFSIKAPVSHGGNTEFIWITVTAIEGERVYGELANDPADLGPLKLGSKVWVKVSRLNDWIYVDPAGNPVGAFTMAAMQKAAKRGKKG